MLREDSRQPLEQFGAPLATDSCSCVLVPPRDVRASAVDIARELYSGSHSGRADLAEVIVDAERLAAAHFDVLGEWLESLARADAATRLAAYRTDALLEQVRRRQDRVLARLAAIDDVDDAESRARDEHVWRDEARAVLERIDALEPIPDPEAEALAREWDALEVARSQRVPDVDLAAAAVRVAEARVARARLGGGVDPVLADRIHVMHARVRTAEDRVEASPRRDRFDAELHLGVAAEEEGNVLAKGGFASYADFLFALAEGMPGDHEARALADAELRDAEAALEEAQSFAGLKTAADVATRSLELRASAAAILGHFPGEDVAGELREHVIAPPEAEALTAQLGSIVSGGAPRTLSAATDPIVAARSWLESDPIEVPEQLGPAAARAEERARLRDDLGLLEAEERTLEAWRKGSEVERIGQEQRLHELEAARRQPLRYADAVAIRGAVRRVLEHSARPGSTTGTRPLVFAGAFDSLDREARIAAIQELDDAGRQVVVVTGSVATAEAAAIGRVRADHDSSVAVPAVGRASA